MNLIQLFEMPQIVGDIDWSLSDESFNRKHLASLLRNKDTEFLENFNKLKLYRNKGQFFAITENEKLAYWIKTKQKYHSMISETAITQVALWRDTDNLHSKNLPSYVFFDYLLKEFHTIMVDSQQTKDGKRFWMNRVAEAFDKELFVYYAKIMSPRVLTRFIDKDEFTEAVHSIPIWGESIHFQDKKVIISDHELIPKSDVKFET